MALLACQQPLKLSNQAINSPRSSTSAAFARQPLTKATSAAGCTGVRLQRLSQPWTALRTTQSCAGGPSAARKPRQRAAASSSTLRIPGPAGLVSPLLPPPPLAPFAAPPARAARAGAKPAAAAATAAAGGGDASGLGRAASPGLQVVLPTALALLLCNMDRICLSVAIVPIALEQSWGPATQGLVQSAFLWGYMATQLLGGYMADKHGGKVVLGCAIAWFSLASMLLPAALSPQAVAAGLALPLAVAARVAVGLGEGVALPSMNNLVATHLPMQRRATALGQVFSGFHAGNILGLIVSPIIMVKYGWRALFYAFGLAGAPLLLFWAMTVPPKTTRAATGTAGGVGISPVGKVAAKQKVSLGSLLRSGPVWSIIAINFVNHWGYFIYLNWMPSYFYQIMGLDLKASTLMSLAPWVAMAIGSSAAGVVADSMIQSGVDVAFVRKLMQCLAFVVPACALLLLTSGVALSPALAVGCLTTALGVTSLGQAGFVANMSDVAPGHAGQLFGLCNTFGSLAGILGTFAVGAAVQATGSFDIVFRATAVMYLAGALLWARTCVARQLFY